MNADGILSDRHGVASLSGNLLIGPRPACLGRGHATLRQWCTAGRINGASLQGEYRFAASGSIAKRSREQDPGIGPVRSGRRTAGPLLECLSFLSFPSRRASVRAGARPSQLPPRLRINPRLAARFRWTAL